MKKNVKLVTYLLFFVFSVSMFLFQVNAYTVKYSSTIGGSYPEIRRYVTKINGTEYMSYCLDPGRQFGGGSSHTMQTSSIIPLNPSRLQVGTNSYKFALAAQYTYQKMVNNSWANRSDIGYAVGNTAFRIITQRYMDGGIKVGALAPAYRAYNNFGSGLKKMTGIQDGINTAIEAIDFADRNGNTPYETLLSDGTINGTSWSLVQSEIKQVPNTNNYELLFEIKPSNEGIVSVDYGRFNVTLLNQTVKIISTTSRQGTGNSAIVSVSFDGTNWDHQDLGAYVDTYYCDPRSAASMLYIVNTKANNQRFLIALPGEVGACPNANPDGGSRHRIPTGPSNDESCSCDTSTGQYKYEKYKNGNLIASDSWYATDKDSEDKKNKYGNCPGTCEKTPHSCQTPSESGDGNYYCKESSPGAGDGEKCTKELYESDCLGKPLCTPTVTVPSDCNNFDTESTHEGRVSDINKVSTSCNPTVNPVTSCVLGGNDAIGESFEAVNEFQGNPYCRVWCVEDYQFKLPTAKYSQSGGYFTLSTQIVGQRDCYVGGASNPQGSIDHEKFNKDYEAAQKAVIDAWNEYNSYKTALSSGNYSTGSSCCSRDEDGNCTSSVTTVSLTWSPTQYNINGQSSTASKSYNDGSCSHGDGHDPRTKDNYHSGSKSYKTLKEEYYKKLKDATEHLNTIISQFNSCTGAISNQNHSGDLTSVDPSSVSSSTWNNDMVFGPDVEFYYNEDYKEQVNGKFKIDGEVKEESIEGGKEWYCGGDSVNNQYTECQNGTSNSQYWTYQNKKVVTCSEGKCGSYDVNISTAKWIRKSKKYSAKYIPDKQFSTYTQYGTIKLKWDQCSGNDCLWTNLPEDALPITLVQKSGVFPFKFKFSKIGQSNSKTVTVNDLGRLMGSTTSVLTEYNKMDSNKTCNSGMDVTSTVDGGYVCHYLNNCDDCDFICKDDECDFNDDDEFCGDCDLTCETCLFDGDRAMYSYKIVSLNKLFKNTERRIGWNWFTGDDSNRVANKKAKDTLSEIEEAGESIYETPQYEFTLSPSDLKKIREYNNAAGSYTNSKIPDSYAGSLSSNNALRCEKYTDVNGKEHTVRCKSGFLDVLEGSNKLHASDITRITSDNSNVGGESTSAWELYPESKYCQGDDKNECSKYGIGPSWRIRSGS